uniref:CARD domain-containing protein n=1 Tax=Terrapene triunguis TaxID=2587831 RepID=A0A674K0B1_9SAUR
MKTIEEVSIHIQIRSRGAVADPSTNPGEILVAFCLSPNPLPNPGDVGPMAFETIRQGRERLIALLLTTPDPVLHEVASLGIVTEEEYEALEKLSEPRERIRRLLIKIQRNGERGCEQFLECLQSLFPDFPPDLQPPGRRELGLSESGSICFPFVGCITETNNAENPEGGTSSEKNRAENPEAALTSGKNELENPETTLLHEENYLGNPDGRPSSGKNDPQNSEDATSSEKNVLEKLEKPEKL